MPIVFAGVDEIGALGSSTVSNHHSPHPVGPLALPSRRLSTSPQAPLGSCDEGNNDEAGCANKEGVQQVPILFAGVDEIGALGTSTGSYPISHLLGPLARPPRRLSRIPRAPLSPGDPVILRVHSRVALLPDVRNPTRPGGRLFVVL